MSDWKEGDVVWFWSPCEKDRFRVGHGVVEIDIKSPTGLAIRLPASECGGSLSLYPDGDYQRTAEGVVLEVHRRDLEHDRAERLRAEERLAVLWGEERAQEVRLATAQAAFDRAEAKR